MIFSHPLWLPAGVAACLGLLWAWRRYTARQRAALAQFVAPHLLPLLTQSVSSPKARTKRALLLGAVALLFVALAGPEAGYHWEQLNRRGNDILFAVDTSRSMLTPDVKPNRLTRAKLAIDDFVQRLDGDAVGLIAFAGDAFLQSPLTLDYDAFHESLNALDTQIVPRGGTNIASAIQSAQSALKDRSGSDKILVLVTDGEDLQGNALTAAKAAAEQGLKIYTVGVGTANGDLIALPADQGGGFIKDAAGNPVKSRLDESALKAIASATSGLYAPLGAEGQGLDSIYQQALAPLAKHDLASRRQKVYTQRYQWPLAAAFGMLLASVLLGNRRRIHGRRTEKDAESSLVRRILPRTAALSALLLAPLHPAHASATSAAKAYAEGDFLAAAQDYAAAAQHDPKRPALQYNLGTAAYRAGEFPKAAAAFQSSLASAQSADAKRLAEQQNAYYNLGNTLYRIGQKTEQSSPDETIKTWTQAVKAYDTALQMRTSDADSKFNRDLVMRKLAQVKESQRQSQQSQQNGQSQSDGNSQQKQQAQNQQNDQDQSGKQAQQEKQSSKGKDSKQVQNNSSQQSPQPSGGGTQPKDHSQTAAQSHPNPPSPSVAAQPSAVASGSNAAAADQREEDTIADNQRAPGQMSREEARELLDSVKDEQHRYPVDSLPGSGNNSIPVDQSTKDW